MAFESSSTLSLSEERGVVATSRPTVTGSGGGVPELQSEAAAYPSGTDPKRFAADDKNNPESSIQSAIDYAAGNGGGHIVISRDLTGWDVSQISHDPDVVHYLEGQEGAGHNVQAYGAAGDGSTDDHAAFQKAHDQAAARSQNLRGLDVQSRLIVPYSSRGPYLLSDEWHITTSLLEIVGTGMYTPKIKAHSGFDSSKAEALVRVGDGAGGSPSETNSIHLRDLDIVGKGHEISGLTLHFWYSGYVENCRLIGGEYDGDSLGRETAGLHVRSGKNLFVSNCQMATHDAYGVLVDDRGDSGNNHNNPFVLRECLITEGIAGVYVKNGYFHTKLINNTIGGHGSSHNLAPSGHDVYIAGSVGLTITNNVLTTSTYGVALDLNNRIPVQIHDNVFKENPRQSIATVAGNYKYLSIQNNYFRNCGTQHTEGGSIDDDYTTTSHVADIHIDEAYGAITHIQGNVHQIEDQRDPKDRYAAIIGTGSTYEVNPGDEAYHLFQGNGDWGNGYLTPSGDVVHASQTYLMDDTRLIINDTGEEEAGAGSTPTKEKWRVGDFVLNTDDSPPTLYLLKPSGDWYDFQTEVAADIGNDGTVEIPNIGTISSQNDPQGVVSEGGGTSELLYDFGPLPYKAEDETITGQWEYEQEIDWTSQIDGVGYEGYVQIPVDNAAQTEYILISELGGNGTNQRLTATLFVGRTTGSSVGDHGAVEVYYNQNGDGSNRNFSTRSVVDTEKANEGFDARPVAIDYNGTRWAAVEVSVGYDKIQWRTLSPHHTGNYDLSTVESKSSSNVSNVTPWEDASEGSLAREEVRAKSLMHDESRSFDFQSGWASGDGWIAAEVGPEGKPNFFEASHMVLRGTLRVRELILEQLRVRKGIQIISPGGGKVERVESELDNSIDASEFHNWTITAVDTSADTVTLDNSSESVDPTATLGAGQKVAISGSTGNGGNYTVASLTDNGDGTTTVEVNENISDSTADGRLFEATVQRWYFEDPNDTSSAHGMQSGDRVLAQRFDPEQQQVVAQVRAVVELVYTTHEVEVTVSTNYTVPSVGQETEGFEFAVVASANGNRQSILVDSPFQPGREVLDGLTDFDDWDNRADFLRKLSGNLDGRYDYSQEAYGLAAGPTDGEYITADSVKGVRIVDNTGGNQTVRAQLVRSALTLGSTAAEHILIDPNQSGLQFINASGTEVARFDGTLLRLGSNGAIRFDPTRTPEAFIEDTLQIGGSGALVMDTPGGTDALTIDQSASFTTLPTQQSGGSTTTTTTGTPTASVTLSNGTQYKSHQVEVTIENPSSSSADFRVTIKHNGTGDVGINVPGLAAGATETVALNYNPAGDSNVTVKSSNLDGTSQAQINSASVYYWESFQEINALGIRMGMGTDAFFEVAHRLTRIGGGVEIDREGMLFAENGDLKWLSYETNTSTTIAP